MKICIIEGTRPEIIKLAPVVRYCEAKKLDYFVIHTGQHYSYMMDSVFFQELKLPRPKYNLHVGSDIDAREVANIMLGVASILEEHPPSIVLVEGDTSSVLAGALAASKMHIQVGHVEAGLRCFDRTMPEEINRTLVDHCADYLFAPTEVSKSNLLHEGIEEDKIFVVGNTIADMVLQNCQKSRNNKGYILLTLHRQENVDDVNRLLSIMDGIKRVYEYFKMPIIFPVHPRTQDVFDRMGFETVARIIEPVGYYKFLELAKDAAMIMTDSGGVQEEACILGVPCVTLRDNTERPETVEIGANIVAGISQDSILRCSKEMMGKHNTWQNPFGNGDTGSKIVDILMDVL